ncbi:MAG TPA: sigma-70 family RNA polymerase sigma factor [Solirubrobacteraceae bacterium]
MEQTSTAGLTAALKWRRGLALRSQTARGDDAALTAMYERHHQALYRYCRSILHDDEDARDALQSTMAKALSALRDEERDFELRPWLFRIAHNEAISRLRQRRDSVDLDAVGTLGTDSLAQTVEDRERLALLRADLRDLPERQRSALVLRELSGLSHEEIAVVLDSSASAVKQTIFEARAGLHECAEGRTMLCADVQRALSDGDGRVLRGRRMRAHVRSCRACRTFKTALAHRPADLAALAPALPATAGAALLAHLLPGAAKAGLASSAGTAAGAGAGAGGGIAATVASKVAIVAVATATLAGTGSVVRDAVTAPDRDARPAVAAPSAPRARPISSSASAPGASRPAASAPAAGAALRPRTGAHATSHRPKPSPGAKAKGPPAIGALPTQAQHGRRVAKGQATAQAKREAAQSRRRRSGLKHVKSHPAHPAKRTPPVAAANARPAHPEHPAVAAGPLAHAQPAGTEAPQPAVDAAPAVTTPPGNAGAAHAAK